MPLDRMNPDHKERFKVVLIAFATLHLKDPAKELDIPRVQIYWNSLKDYDIEQIEAAGRTLIDTCGSFPKPMHFHRVLRKIASKRVATSAMPTDDIWCEWCDDLGIGVWYYGEHGEGPGRPMRYLEFRDMELRRRPPPVPHGVIPKQPPRHRWKACSCRNSNPNYQARAKEHDIPPPSSIEDGYEEDPHKWSQYEATQAVARFAPKQKGLDW